MVTLTMSDELEAAVIEAKTCKRTPSLEVDRRRLRAHIDGEAAGVSHECADAWLSRLAAGKWSKSPR